MKFPLIFMAAAIVLQSCSSKSPQQQAAAPPATEVVTITTGSALTENEYTASLEGKTDVEIRPQVDGRLAQVLVDEGSFVHAGQGLFKIDDLPYREQYNSALAGLHAAEATISSTQLEIDKIAPLVKNKVVSEVQLKSARATHQLAIANAEQAKAAVAAAQINLGYTLVKAPVSGYIGRLPKKQGSLVGHADPQALTTLTDVAEVNAYFSLSEGDFIRFKEKYPGSTINDKLKALPPVTLLLADNTEYNVQGHVTMIDGQFDKHTAAITLRASFPNPQGLLRSGNTGRVRLAIPHDAVVLVPAAATLEMQDKLFVYVVGDSNKVAKTPITISGKSGDNYIVQSGIASGQRIVFSGLDHMQDGVVIQPVAPAGSKAISMKQ